MHKMGQRIILASTSPQRNLLLKQLVANFETAVPDLENETLAENKDFEAAVADLAEQKTLSVAHAYPDALLIGADTIVVHAGVMYGKPLDVNEAFLMLKKLSGGAHSVMTGVCLHMPSSGQTLSFTECTQVFFKANSDDQILKYLRTKEWIGRAGAYAIQEKGVALTEKIIGSYTNVVGLPLEKLSDQLIEFGVDVYV